MKKRRRYLNDPPPPGGVSYQEVHTGPPIYHFPQPAKTTRLKFDKATGTWIIDPDQTPKPSANTAPDQPPVAE